MISPAAGDAASIRKIVSGGQTGVDRAALDVAHELQIPLGGWCPRGRRTEDGMLGREYPLEETPSADYSQRTEWNVRDSDATLILTRGPLQGGTALTCRIARERMHRPCLVVDLRRRYDTRRLWAWLQQHSVRTLNIAGPRESQQPGIYDQAVDYLRRFLRELPGTPQRDWRAPCLFPDSDDS